MDATSTNTTHPRNGIADRQIKQTRKDKLKSNHGRTELSKSSKSAGAIEKHNLRLKCIDSYLTSLPDTQLHSPAKYLASVILSTAIERKHHYEVLKKATTNPDFIPSSARFKFKLGGTKAISGSPAFKALEIETANKVIEFRQ